jgi:hypothetical protein
MESYTTAEALPESIGFGRESLLECLRCIRILACQDSHDITLEWMICQS